MENFLKFFGAIIGIFAGTLLIVIGIYNAVVNIQQGSFFALSWLLAAIVGGWFIDLGCNEFKKGRS